MDFKEKKEMHLYRLRKCSSRDTLEKVIEVGESKYSNEDLQAFNSAADHRLAEIIMGRRYDTIPPAVWTFVR
ncbi:Hha/YmoA family nucleoid-associated regulatory protein [Pectobacterium carotovorum]|uniref:Hha/YmoA family nucleoid-associated regulatory protein n=1 Tax=Pectobacterium carotovorum TaxID=554 RepID=UPI000505109D|nr:Hha/YmoA family nucleoid-associated regulatory protein [Pectobacterium carotovorum]KFW97733.1 hypothetical protein JV33_20510 [Pectobacterium carotovorum subsp. carotovorum]KML64993.1 hypothetical protein G032_21305 [Pectobacterium carotovorum subsp. carotovorum ICMP 5702]SHH69773.1 haemolysin expression modulating protein [Pectobacterium carotovorum]